MKPNFARWLLVVVVALLSAARGDKPPAETDYDDTSDVNALLKDLDSSLPPGDQRKEGEVKRFWGVPDTTATEGRLFNYSIPADAFSGVIRRFEVSEAGEPGLPPWLSFEPRSRTFLGVPLGQDVGQHYISVKALGSSDGPSSVAKDVFSVEVVEETSDTMSNPVLAESGDAPIKCGAGDALTLASVIVDFNPDKIGPVGRVQVLARLAAVLNIPPEQMRLSAVKPDSGAFDSSAILAGPGNAKKQRTIGAALQWQVGCSGNISPDRKESLVEVEKSAAGGGLAEILGASVIGWQVVSTHPRLGRRERRQLGGLVARGTPVPGILPTHWPRLTDKVDEMEATDDSATPDSRVVPTMASPIFVQPSLHPHRHRHGEHDRGRHRFGVNTASPTLQHHILAATPFPTPVVVPDRPTRYGSQFIGSLDAIGPSRHFPAEHTPPVDELMPSMTSPIIFPATGTEMLPSRTFMASADVTSEVRPTKSRAPGGEGTKKPAGTPNFRPTIHSRMKKLSMVAGKVWRYQIPRDTFVDLEDGDTRHLKLIFTTVERTSMSASSWIQFDPEKQTLYALPLDENIGKYEFILEAMDSEGATIHDRLEIHVWQHQSARARHHEFSVTLRYNRWQFPIAVDWRIEAVRKLAQFFGDRDENMITVQSVTSDPVTMIWSNDSLPAYPCPNEEITALTDKLLDESTGEVSRLFRKSMGTEFRVMDASVNFLGVCRSPASTTSSTHTNFGPMIRNAIEQINTTAGEILRFKVPDDTFYDFEDGSTRYLTLTFLTIDNVRPPKSSWVQFDPKSQELYGLPFEGDTGRHEYQLVAMDSSGLQINDAFVIVVHPRPPKRWSVEFSIHLDLEYDDFSRDISKKVLVAWKLAKLYSDPDPRFITVISISKGSVVYAWTNNTLLHDPCPKQKVERLVKSLFNENKTISSRLTDAMLPEFRIIKADAMPLGICLGEMTPTSVTATSAPVPQETTPTITSDDDIYITTIIPAIVIAVMLIIAALVACFLYRKKRKGKMTMQDNSTFISKGIPIIFADELDEKPDPAKPPVIMKEEKPPLAPPEYLRSSSSSRDSTPQLERGEHQQQPPQPIAAHDTSADLHPDPNSSPPYQPPPPFTTNRDSKNARPKATPTYRQPPPYVPP